MVSSLDICKKLQALGFDAKLHGGTKCAKILCSYTNVCPDALVWYNGNTPLNYGAMSPEIIILGKSYPDVCGLAEKASVISVENPRLCFAITAKEFFSDQISFSKGFTDPKLYSIVENSYVGKNTVIGENVELGKNVMIGPNCTIMPNVKIGENVTIGAGSVIGSPGFGFVEYDDSWVEFPQVGGVSIGDGSRIGANCCIDSGALNTTYIGQHVIISNACQIAHNVKIENHVTIASRVTIGGSCNIGKNAKIWQGAVLSKGIDIGHDAEVMLGSVVVEDVEPMKRVSGNFATSHQKHMLSFAKMRKR